MEESRKEELVLEMMRVNDAFISGCKASNALREKLNKLPIEVIGDLYDRYMIKALATHGEEGLLEMSQEQDECVENIIQVREVFQNA